MLEYRERERELHFTVDRMWATVSKTKGNMERLTKPPRKLRKQE